MNFKIELKENELLRVDNHFDNNFMGVIKNPTIEKLLKLIEENTFSFGNTIRFGNNSIIDYKAIQIEDIILNSESNDIKVKILLKSNDVNLSSFLKERKVEVLISKIIPY